MEPLKVEKFSTTDRGNGLRALAPLRPGELLFRSDPLAYTVCKGSRGLVCERCLLGFGCGRTQSVSTYASILAEVQEVFYEDEGIYGKYLVVDKGKEKLMRCSQCRVAKYCSAKCQKKAWPDHKRECKCLKSCKPRYPPDSVRLLGRVVVKLMEETPSESEKLYSFYDLESNVSKLTEDKKEGIRQLAVTFQHFMREEVQDMSQLPPAFDVFEAFAKVTLIKMSGGPGNDPEGQDFFTFSKRSFLLTDEASRHPRMKNSNMCIDSPKTYFTVRSLEEVISAMLQHPSFGLSWTTLHISPSRFAVLCNAFTICDAEMQGVGVGLYPSMSLLNHSCDPNCSVVFNGPHLLLRAVRDVEAGEELTICYLDLLMTSEERREHLRGQYCFDCDCVRCQTQDKDADMLTGDEQVWKEVRESLKKIEELKAQWKWEQVLAMCQVILSSNAERLPDINIYQLKVLDCAMDACIHLGLLEEALFYGLRTMEPYRVFFPGSHPVRGVQVMKVGKLQLHQGMLPQAMKNLRLAFDIMRVTHGREHRLMEDLILLLEECDVSIRAS